MTTGSASVKVPESSIRPAKIALTPVWIWAFVCVVAPGSFPHAVTVVGRVTFWGMAIAHLIELYAMWMPYVKRAPGSFAGHVAQVVLFGLFHGNALRYAEERAAPRV